MQTSLEGFFGDKERPAGREYAMNIGHYRLRVREMMQHLIAKDERQRTGFELQIPECAGSGFRSLPGGY